MTTITFNPLDWPLETVNSCNLCGRVGARQIASTDRYGFKIPAQQCNHCGHVYLSPRPTAETYSHFYQEVYRPLVSAYHNREINERTIQADQLEYAKSVAEFIGPCKVSGQALDIGGSTGVVAEYLQTSFLCQFTVLDPAPAELKAAQGRGLDTIAASVEDVEMSDNSFDFVTMCQTIDHLLDPFGTLEKVLKWLKPGGLIFVDAVDFRMTGETKIDHPHNFVFETMTELVDSCFDIERFERSGYHLRYLARVPSLKMLDDA